MIRTVKGILVKQTEKDVKRIYQELLELSEKHEVVLCGVVKDSRSRQLVGAIKEAIPYFISSKKIKSEDLKGWVQAVETMQDIIFGDNILSTNERTAWYKMDLPSWINSPNKIEIWTCLVKPITDDQPVRLELSVPSSWHNIEQFQDIALGAFSILCNHGLPLAIPTIILEADERTKMNNEHLQTVIDQISISLGIPKEKLRKRRYFTKSLD